MDNKEVIKYIVIVLLILLTVGLCTYVIVDKTILNKNVKDPSSNLNTSSNKVENNYIEEKRDKDTDKTDEVNNNKDTYQIKKILYDTSSYKNNTVEKVELTSDGTVLVTMTGSINSDVKEDNIVRKEVLNSVKEAYLVKVGMSDICEGNSRIVFIMKDLTVSYLNVDSLVCGHEINIVTNVGNLKNIIEVYDKKDETGYPLEPPLYTVYAKNEDENIIDISKYLEDN